MKALQVEGCVIVSADGMLADAHGDMPASLKFEGDQRWFQSALDRADIIVHGRNSFEDQPNSAERKRIILSHSVAALAPDPDNPKATLWNPQGASFEEACARAGVTSGVVAVIGGPVVFKMFLDRYDRFWLSVASQLYLHDGKSAFGKAGELPQQSLAAHGLVLAQTRPLDPEHGVSLTEWRRA